MKRFLLTKLIFRIKKPIFKEKSRLKEQNCIDRAHLLSRDFNVIRFKDEEEKKKHAL